MLRYTRPESAIGAACGQLSATVFTLMVIALSSFPSRAASVTLTWDPDAEPDVAGYRLYYGEPPGDYAFTRDVGNVTNQTVPNLVEGKTYAFYVTCFNSSRLESDPSNVVNYSVPAPSTNLPPVAYGSVLQTRQDQPTEILFHASDPEGAPLNYTIVDVPLNGALTGYPTNEAKVRYAPVPGYVGSDHFTFTVRDGLLESAPATVSINVVASGAPFISSAGYDQIVTLPASALLQGLVTRDGVSYSSANLTTSRAVLSGPRSVAFANASSLGTRASFSTPGTYVLRLSAMEGQVTTTDDVAVTVNDLTRTTSVITRVHASEGTLTDPMDTFVETVGSGTGASPVRYIASTSDSQCNAEPFAPVRMLADSTLTQRVRTIRATDQPSRG